MARSQARTGNGVTSMNVGKGGKRTTKVKNHKGKLTGGMTVQIKKELADKQEEQVKKEASARAVWIRTLVSRHKHLLTTETGGLTAVKGKMEEEIERALNSSEVKEMAAALHEEAMVAGGGSSFDYNFTTPDTSRVGGDILNTVGLADEDPSTSVCWRCRCLFPSSKDRDDHTCRQRSQDMVSFAIEMASQRIEDGNVALCIERNSPNENKSEEAMFAALDKLLEKTASTFVPMVFPRGWARRPKHGLRKGATYIEQHKPRLFDLFMEGEGDKKKTWPITNAGVPAVRLPWKNGLSRICGGGVVHRQHVRTQAEQKGRRAPYHAQVQKTSPDG